MSLDSEFQQAAEASKKLPSQSNQNLLKLYALYKQASKGDVSGSKPGAFDLKGQAKYNAWTALKGTKTEDAMRQYIELVASLKA